MRSDTRYREARSSLLASLFVVLAVFVIGKEPPLLPSPPPVWWEETQWSIAIYLFIFCYRFDRWKCARFNNVDIAILICNNIMYGCSIRVIVKIIENEAQGRKGWKMFKYFRRYILVLKSWDHPTNWDEFKCFSFFTILKIDESSSYEEILIRINVRVGRYRVWWNFEHERRHGSTVSAIDSKFIACYCMMYTQRHTFTFSSSTG